MNSIDETLIYLENDEEITVVIDRLRAAKVESIRFVVPKGALVLQSLVSLKLLKREADRLGKTIAIVTQDPVGLNLGEQANISVFAKAKDDEPVFHAKSEEGLKKPRRLSRTKTDEESPTVSHYADHAAANEDQPADIVEETPVAEALTEQSPAESPEGLDEPVMDAIAVHEMAAVPSEENDIDEVPAHQIGQKSTYVPDAGARRSGLEAMQTADRIKQVTRPAARFGNKLVRLLQVGLIIAILLAGSYLAFISLAPRAAVVLAVASQPLDQTISLTAQTGIDKPDSENSLIPAQLVSADVSTEQSAPATGKKDVGNKATATLNLYNYWDSTAQSFAKGTALKSSDGTAFVTTADATIPGASTTLKAGNVVTTPGTTSVTIEAATPGPDANGKSGTFTIPSLPSVKQDKIYGQSVAATAGGTTKQVTVISQSDLDTLKNTAMDALTVQAKQTLSGQAAGKRILDGAISVAAGDPSYSAKLDDTADTLTLKISGKAQALAFDDSDLNTISAEILRKAVPDGKTILLQSSDTLAPTVKNLDIGAGKLAIDAAYHTRTAIIVDEGRVRNSVTGQTPAAAEAALKGLPDVVDATITHTPSFLKTLPKRDSQVKVTITYVDQPAASDGQGQ